MKLLAALVLALTGAPSLAADGPPELVIYAYDSFAAKGGLGPAIVPIFEKSCLCRVSVLPSGDGGQLLTRVQLDAEAKRKGAHIVVGLDQSLWERAKNWMDTSDEWKPKGLAKVPATYRLGPGFVPFDYGVFAMMVDEIERAKGYGNRPRSLKGLLDPTLKRKIILEDPRTSTPGLAFLLFTQKALGEPDVWKFWEQFRGQWLTLSTGWDQAYGLFLKGEAPLVWSYVTSQAYHIEQGEKTRYQAALFEEGNPLQIEGAAVVKGSLTTPRERELARSFLEFLLSPDVQSRIPQKNWMFPVVKGTKLPESFKALPAVKKVVSIGATEELVKKTLASWSSVIRGGQP